MEKVKLPNPKNCAHRYQYVKTPPREGEQTVEATTFDGERTTTQTFRVPTWVCVKCGDAIQSM